VGQRSHRPIDLPKEVHVDDPLELFGGRLFECGEEPNRGEVHPGVEPAVLLYGALCHSLYLFEIRSISDYGHRLTALAAYLLDQGVETLLAAGRDEHLGAALGEPQGCLAANAAGSSHQHHYLLFYWLQPHIYRSSCYLICLTDLLLASASRGDRLENSTELSRLASVFFGHSPIGDAPTW
jgi:hypothetical protein